MTDITGLDEVTNRQTDNADKTVGVLGGMGPAATARFFNEIIDRTPANTDQEHLHVVINNRPQIPDRIAYINGTGSDPRPYLLDALKTLEQAGADVITMPCNTAHTFIDDIRTNSDAKVLNMIGLTATQVTNAIEDGNVGLLSTEGTIDTGLYHEEFSDTPISVVTPKPEVQDNVSSAIKAVKRGERENPRSLLIDAVTQFDNVDAIVAGCTEIPLALSPEDINPQLFDPMVVLADRVVEYAKAKQ